MDGSMTRIPLDPNGYKVDGSTIHTRYADHGNGQKTRTTKGVATILDGKQGKACVTCYGKTPTYPDAPRPAQKRRVPANGTVTPEATTPTDAPTE